MQSKVVQTAFPEERNIATQSARAGRPSGRTEFGLRIACLVCWRILQQFYRGLVRMNGLPATQIHLGAHDSRKKSFNLGRRGRTRGRWRRSLSDCVGLWYGR